MKQEETTAQNSAFFILHSAFRVVRFHLFWDGCYVPGFLLS